MIESLFQFLFKYRPLVFEQGDFVLGVSRSTMTAILVAGGLAALALVTYRGLSSAGARDRVVLIGLRLVALGALMFCLFRPMLVLKAAVPQQNFLGILIDDSRSMQIADRAGEARSVFVGENFAGGESTLLNALSKKFVLRYFRFSSSAERIPSPDDLTFTGGATRLGPALDRARDELAGLPLAGLVMVTDGADTSDESLDPALASLKARSIPVYTVGVGQERFAHDVQITRVETPRQALKGTSLVVNLVITQTGYAGKTVPLNIEDEGRIVSTQEITLPADGESATIRVKFMASDAGARTFRFRVPTQADEEVTQNNARDALIEVADRKEKILYYEGEPRFEPKFVKLAVEEDKNLQVVLLQRTAENKYLRIGVDNPEELAGGFPKTREELFAYRAVILGSVEAASFTPDQLRMLADFVSRRGGGLLMLGGRRSFAEGGWAGTPVAEVLPVNLETAGQRSAPYLGRLTTQPTRDGSLSPVTQIADTEQASQARWNELPVLTSVNPVREVKLGATVLLRGLDENREEQVVLAYQRYGRGKALAFAVQDSWAWRMQMPLEDTTHRTFWRRLARWLVDGVPGEVTITTTQNRVDPGEPMKLVAEVLDPDYLAVNNGQVVAHVTAPSGKAVDVPMEWTVTHEGEYRATFVPDEQGLYGVRVAAARENKDLGSDLLHIRAANDDGEYFDANMRAPLLKRVAEDTGGQFYTPATVSALPEAISYSGRGVTVVEERDLWDMPAILMLLIASIGGEWAYRRTRGLA